MPQSPLENGITADLAWVGHSFVVGPETDIDMPIGVVVSALAMKLTAEERAHIPVAAPLAAAPEEESTLASSLAVPVFSFVAITTGVIVSALAVKLIVEEGAYIPITTPLAAAPEEESALAILLVVLKVPFVAVTIRMIVSSLPTSLVVPKLPFAPVAAPLALTPEVEGAMAVILAAPKFPFVAVTIGEIKRSLAVILAVEKLSLITPSVFRDNGLGFFLAFSTCFATAVSFHEMIAA